MALQLLLWKNFKLKQRQWGKTLVEILAPLAFFLILVGVRKSQDFMVKSPDCQFKPSPLASSGLVPALTTFCFLGVCQSEDTGYSTRSFFSASELSQINEAITLYNRLYSDPVLSKYRRATEVMPSNWSNPAATNSVNFSSLFNNPSALFDNVTASATQRSLVLSTTLKVPVRLNALQEAGAVSALNAALAPNATAQLICGLAAGASNDSATGGSDGWAAVAALCSQAQFQANLRGQFNLSFLVDQVKSNATDSYNLLLNVTDAPVLSAYITQVTRLSQTSTVLTRLIRVTNMSDLTSTISSVSKLLCGDGETTVTNLLSRLSSSAQQLLQNASSLFSAVNPVFATLRPPQAYCYNQTIVRAVMAEVQQLLSPLGMAQLPNLLFGEVLYYPNNNSTQGNMQLMNASFARLGLLSDLAKAWITTESPRMAEFIANGTQVQDLRNLLTMCIRVSGGGSNSSCQMAADFLAKVPPAKSEVMHWTALKTLVDAVMRRIYYYTACFKLNKLLGFQTEDTMNNYALYLIDEFKQYSNRSKAKFLASVAFDTGGGATFEKYRLRMVSDMVDSTLNYRVMASTWTPAPRSKYPDNFMYFTSFFVHLQEMLEQGINGRMLGLNSSLVNYLRLFPSPCYIQDQFATVIQSFIPMIMTLAWIYSVTLLVNAIVYEKESRLKEMMKIMGLADWEHWLAWFITSGTIMLAATILMTIVIKAGGVIVNSNPVIIFFFIFSFVVSTICEAFFISIFFSNSSVASAFAGVLFFIGYIPYTVVDRFIESMGTGQLLASCLIPQVGFGLGCKYIGLWELANVGIQTSNVAKSPLTDSSFTFSGVLGMLWFDSFLLMLLTWYIEKVFPGKYGVPKPCYFPFTRAYWCSSCAKPDAPLADIGDVEMTGDARHFEEEPKHLPVGAALRALTKVYKAGVLACKKAKDFTAVNSLTYNFYEGQVTSFLGHNGAGKSTTVSILTGLFTPTTGTAYIYGHDIRTQIDQIRKNLGFCPQHNVLFNQLTVEDHIYFYGMLKGLDKDRIGAHIDSFVSDVGLANKRHELSSSLSGGMKRKLSVAMAFVGDSKLIILDEPTAGVDPHARRSIWDVLGKFRTGRTILLTTHHMDEADILGDRICIIDKGRLVCSGSPMFLKKAFGHGYTLTLVTTSPQQGLLEFVRRHVPTAHLGECTTSEVTVKLPFSETGKFGNLFKQLESSRESLGIDSFGIEDCSLEEIFLTVTEADREETVEKDAASVVNLRSSRSSFRKERQLDATAAAPPQGDGADLLDPKQSLDGSSRCATPSAVPVDMQSSRSSRRNSLCQPPSLRYTPNPLRLQVKALWVKRFTVVRRSKIGFVAEFILPMFFILLSLGLQQISTTDGDNPPLQLAPWYMLGTRDPRAARTKSLFTFVETLPIATGNRMNAASLTAHLYNTTSLGTRCVDTPAEYGNDKFPCLTASNPPADWSSAPTNLPLDTSTCRCSYDKYPDSAKCVNWPSPAGKRLLSADTLENYTLYNVTNYIQSTVSQYYKLRFGGFSLFVNDTDPVKNYVSQTEVSAMSTNLGPHMTNNTLYNFSSNFSSAWEALKPTSNDSELLRAQVWFDNRGYVSGPAYLNILHNAVLRSSLPAGVSHKYGVSGWTHPITLRSKYVANVVASSTVTSAITVVSIIFALSFIPASFVLFLITERRTNAKHLQFVSGINPALYWLMNHAWNMINYLIPLVVLIIIFVAFKSDAFVSNETIGTFIVIMLFFGFASAPVMYPFSWVFSVPSKAFTMLACFNLGIGFVTTMSVAIVDMMASQNNDAQMTKLGDALKIVFLIFPHFCLGQGLMELNYYYQFSVRLSSLAASYGVSTQTLASSYGGYVSSSPWEPTRRYIGCMVAHSIVYFGLVLLIEYNFFCGKGCCSGLAYRNCHKDKYSRLLQKRDAEECDVKAERDRVMKNNGNGDCLMIRDLVKIFHTRTGPRAAVGGVALGVGQRECFGFLGVNGAGKTTTFKMLTGDIDPDSGDATLNGHSILTDVLEAHKQMGYCPQFDALLPLLSGRETLELFARIRGVEEDQIPELIKYISRMVGIVPHLDKLTEEYSGGNKRKLSCGIAFIGGPPIVFLDEPTAGMDPGARRFLWRCIQRMVAAGSCVVLTTHSMEDCQALCHRLTIMVNGQLKCIGSPQHLKTKYGQGFTVYLRLPRTAEPSATTQAQQNPQLKPSAAAGAAAGKDRLLTGDVLSLHERFTGELPEAQLREEHGTLLQYQIGQDVSLSRIFDVVNELKQSKVVLDYSVNQTTLDQVFINFAKKQTEMTKDEKEGSRVLGSLKRQIRKKSASVGSIQRRAENRPDFASLGKIQ